MNQVLFH